MRREAWIGQLFAVGFQGTEVAAELRELARDVAPGGFVLFRRNVSDPLGTRRLTDELQKLGGEQPAFICTDQEGGTVARFRDPFTEFPGNRALFRAYVAQADPTLVVRQAAVMARELRMEGVNWNFAPVLDVDSNRDNPVIGGRAFSAEPDEVACLGVAFARALEENGLLSCGKHVPGHGNTSADSHVDLPIETASADILSKREWAPFRAYAEAGLTALMTAHVVYTALDAQRPATLSEKVINGVVRKELGFEGLVITDDLEMKAIDDRYGPEESAIEALVAGCDMLLICHDAEKQRTAHEAVIREDRKSKVLRERVDAALGRIGKAKKRLKAPPPFDLRAIGAPEDRAFAEVLRRYRDDPGEQDPTEKFG